MTPISAPCGNGHLTTEQLEEYLDGVLDGRAHAAAHVSGCATCQAQLDDLRRFDSYARECLAAKAQPPNQPPAFSASRLPPAPSASPLVVAVVLTAASTGAATLVLGLLVAHQLHLARRDIYEAQMHPPLSGQESVSAGSDTLGVRTQARQWPRPLGWLSSAVAPSSPSAPSPPA
jgi:hypothetical protein